MAREPASTAVRWVVALVLFAGVAFFGRQMLAAPSVDTVRAESRDIVETLAVVGRVRAPARAALGASIAASVVSVRVDEGDAVAAGDVLVVLDDREAGAQLRQAEATLADAAARSTTALAEAEREAAQSARDLDRVRSVVDEGGLTRQALEQAEQRAADAASRLAAVRAQAPGGGEVPAAVAMAHAAVQSARARFDLTRLTAPAAGVVVSRIVEPGDVVSPGRTLLEIAFEGPAELIVFPGEENLGRLVAGAPARASADAFPDRTFAATVSLIAPTVDPSQGTVAVRLSIAEPQEYLLPDMTVSVNIETGRRTGATILPEDAVQGLGAGQPWIAIVEDGRLQRVDVTVGLRAEGYVEVTSGVTVGDEVVRSADPEAVGERVRVVGRTD